MKTAISLPDELFADTDHAAARLRVSRSELVRRALTAYLAQLPATSVTEQLNSFYDAHPDLNSLAPGWEAAQAEALGRDPW